LICGAAAAQQPLPVPAVSVVPRNVPIPQIEQTLRSVLGGKIVPTAQGKYALNAGRNGVTRRCILDIDLQQNRLQISGDQTLCDQLVQLVQIIDQPAPVQGWERRFVPIQNAKSDAVTKLFELCKVPRRIEPLTQPRNFHPVKPANSPVNNPANSNVNPLLEFRPTETRRMNPLAPSSVVQLVDFEEPIPRGTPPGSLSRGGGPGEISPNLSLGGTTSGDSSAKPVEVVSDFRYQILPDLDVLVIDATGAEVARFTDMIRQIEELSKISEPQIEVIPLKHLNCVSLQLVLGQFYNDVLKAVQGAVRVQPMINPNAMLLVGWGKSMESMKHLIESLDKPIAAENSMLQVFRLKHASAQYAQTVLKSTFPNPAKDSAFMSRINVFAETRANIVIVQAAPNDLKDVERIIEELDVQKAAVKLQVKPFRLKHSLAPDLVKVLNDAVSAATGGTTDKKSPALELLVQDEKGRRLVESGIMSDVKISQDIRNNTIIVTAPDSCMPFIEELILQLDADAPTAEIKLFQILHGDASSIIEVLKSLIPAQLDGQPSPQLPGAAGEENLIPIRFAIETRSNCIIAAGSPGDLKIVEALLFSLDREDQQTRRQSVYELKSMKAENVAKAIDKYVESRRTIQKASPGVISQYQLIESEVIVVPEPSSNTLIISATPKYYDEIIALIKEIDKSPPQVVIRVLIGEVTLSDTNEYGLELGIQDSLLFNRSSFSADGTATPGWSFNKPGASLGNNIDNGALASAGNLGSQMLTNFATGSVGAETGFSGMVLSANSDSINIMLRALAEKSRLEILSCPQITAMNNQQAVIHVGQQVPRYQGVVTNGTTSQPIVKDEKVGLMLTVQPNISPEGTIVMTVMATKSKIGTDAEGVIIGSDNGTPVRSPKIDIINTATMVSASNNETVILGGLIQKEDQKLNRKVPLLGDIPLLGKLFSYDYNKCKRSELLIILTPRIVRDKNDMEQVKQMEAARMSWCLGNVAKVYGDIGVYNTVSETPYVGNVEVVNPEPVKIEMQEPTLAPPMPMPVLPGK
jgi:type II secretion system protein D